MPRGYPESVVQAFGKKCFACSEGMFPHFLGGEKNRAGSRGLATTQNPLEGMAVPPRDIVLPLGIPRQPCQIPRVIGHCPRAAHLAWPTLQRTPCDWAKGLMQPAPKPSAKGSEHAFRPNIQCDWAIPLMRGDVRHQRYCPIAPVICNEPASGDHDLHQENGHDLNTKRRRTREGGPPPTTRASAACDYPPRYAFRTSSSTSSSAPVPDFLIVPISST